jgi:hypothetical protein
VRDNPSGCPKEIESFLKGGYIVIKNAFIKAGIQINTALVILGWICFALGKLNQTNNPFFSFVMLATARVLP